MRWRDARAILEFWGTVPPVAEMLAVLAQVYTTWRPSMRKRTDEEAREALMAEQRRKWESGAALNAEQLFRAMGGRAAGEAVALDAHGNLKPSSMVGGPWPFDPPGKH